LKLRQREKECVDFRILWSTRKKYWQPQFESEMWYAQSSFINNSNKYKKVTKYMNENAKMYMHQVKSDTDISSTMTHTKKDALNDNGNIRTDIYSSFVSVNGSNTILDRVAPKLQNMSMFGVRLNGPVSLI